ncbi:MAG: ABC transporter permease [Clostridiales bacterium]|nr:ABC transporter permease [Clostridiales bacterium]
MRRMLYARIAAKNIRGGSQFYFPFILAAIITVACFFIMASVGLNRSLAGGDNVRAIMRIGVAVTGVFALIFLCYTDSFLIRRRKRELGLYNILGMEKRHVAKVLSWETFFSACISIAAGIGLGILLDRLMFLVLMNLVNFDLAKIKYEFQPLAVLLTAAVFAAIFIVLLLYGIAQVAAAKPVELLRSENVGEREPKAKKSLAATGVVSLGAGYFIAVTANDFSKAIGTFALAVILVMIGTYLLFISVSTAVLKFLKSRKKYYYKASHFVSISGLSYRMKQNAVGLANICILSTMVMVTVAVTASLYAGMEDVVAKNYPHEVEAHFYGASDEYQQYIIAQLGEAEEEFEMNALNLNAEFVDGSDWDFCVTFDLDGNRDEMAALEDAFISRVSEYEDSSGNICYIGTHTCRQDVYGNYYEMYGGFLFLGIFLGTLFMMAAVLTIYYKQVIEGYEDRKNFAIMKKVGMDSRLIASSAKSQVLSMFLLPLIVATLHLCFAFPLVRMILSGFGMGNTGLLAMCVLFTLLVYAVLYIAVYVATARTYYRIVNRNAYAD